MKVDLTNQVIVLDGLNVKAANDGSHEAGMAALWTGTTIQNNGGNATGPSIDQAIAPLLTSQLSINRPYSTLPLMAQSSADYQERSVDTRMLYDATGNWVDPYADPAAALANPLPERVFERRVEHGGEDGVHSPAGVSTGKQELAALQGRLCTEDRVQLQALQIGMEPSRGADSPRRRTRRRPAPRRR